MLFQISSSLHACASIELEMTGGMLLFRNLEVVNLNYPYFPFFTLHGCLSGSKCESPMYGYGSYSISLCLCVVVND